MSTIGVAGLFAFINFINTINLINLENQSFFWDLYCFGDNPIIFLNLFEK